MGHIRGTTQTENETSERTGCIVTLKGIDLVQVGGGGRRKGGGGENRRYRLAASMRAHLQEGAFDRVSSSSYSLYIIFLSCKFCIYYSFLFLRSFLLLPPTCTYDVLSITEDTFIECISRSLNSPIHLNLIRSTSHRNAPIRKLSARNNSSRSLVARRDGYGSSLFVFWEKSFA